MQLCSHGVLTLEENRAPHNHSNPSGCSHRGTWHEEQRAEGQWQVIRGRVRGGGENFHQCLLEKDEFQSHCPELLVPAEEAGW
jgi:hypothetical protein